jgi:antitoxin component YwqK of YwqJK toxin-antitoxin module
MLVACTNQKNSRGQKDGSWEVYHSNGKLWYKGDYEDGVEDGEWFYYFRDGRLSRNGTYSEGKRHGIWIDSDEYSHEIRSASYDIGVLHGAWSTNTSKDQLIEEGEYFNGLPHGNWISYYLNGQPRDSIAYDNGRVCGTSVSYYPSGALESRAERVNGNVFFTSFYEGGEVESVLVHNDNNNVNRYNVEGSMTELNFSLTGKVSSIQYYRDGDWHGPQITFYDDGKVKEIMHWDTFKPMGWRSAFNVYGAIESEGYWTEFDITRSRNFR